MLLIKGFHVIQVLSLCVKKPQEELAAQNAVLSVSDGQTDRQTDRQSENNIPGSGANELSTQINVDTLTHAQVHVHIRRYTQICVDTRTHAQVHVHMRNECTHICLDTLTHAQIHVHMRRYTYTCVDTHTHARYTQSTHAYMQTHGVLANLYPEILIF